MKQPLEALGFNTAPYPEKSCYGLGNQVEQVHKPSKTIGLPAG